MNDLLDDDITAFLKISIRRNGSMSVEGCINEEVLAKAMLDSARDCIGNYNKPKINGNGLVLPPSREFIQ